MLRIIKVISWKPQGYIPFCRMSDNIASIRLAYRGDNDHFDMHNLHSKNPFQQFEKWFQEARDVKSILEPNAMSIASATKSGIPSVRMVLLKGVNEEKGFTFFTNYESRKAKELDENPFCSIMFYWEPLNRSIRVEGTVTRTSESESEEYFKSRPRDSQIGAIVSHQSQVIPNRTFLDDRLAKIKEQFDKDEQITKPDYWGGYNILPNVFEFWQGQTNRLHDRIVFRRPANSNDTVNPETTIVGDNGWLIERLSS